MGQILDFANSLYNSGQFGGNQIYTGNTYSSGAVNPFYSEETGHIPLDELAPWQQALMNPGANNPGMSMPAFDQNNPYYQFTQYGPNQPGALPAGYDPYAISNGIAGVYNGSNLTGSNQGGGTGTNAGQMVDPAVTFNNANRTTSPPPGNTTTRTTAPTPTIASPSLLATNMSMTGAQNVGGMGMYTGSNGPLDTTRFTPVQGQQQNGPPPGSIPTGDPNTFITPWGATYTTPGSVNNSSSAAYDAYRQRAFGDMMGPMGRGPSSNPYQELTDVLRLAPGSINAQTFQGYLGSLQGQQTGPNPPQQTAPLPRQGGGQQQQGNATMRADPYRNFESNSPGQPGYNPNYGQQGGGQSSAYGSGGMTPSQRSGQPGQTPMQNFPGYNPQPLPGAFPMGDPRGTWGGMYDAQYGQGAYQRMQDQERAQQDQMLAAVGLRRGTPQDSGYYMDNFQDLRLDPLGIGIDTRGIVMADGSKVNWQQLTQQYGANKFGGNKMFQPQPQPGYGQNPYQMQQSPVIGSPGMMGRPGQMQVDPAMEYGSFRGGSGNPPNPNYQQMAAQFSSDPASQQAYMRDMFGGGQQQQNPYQNVDFRAATFGGSLFPDTNKAPGAATTGSGGTNTPTNYNPMQGGQLLGGSSWGGATNRRGGFGGMSLFGNQFGSGGSTGFGGTQPSQYRGAGTYGRPASYGQSQRPY